MLADAARTTHSAMAAVADAASRIEARPYGRSEIRKFQLFAGIHLIGLCAFSYRTNGYQFFLSSSGSIHNGRRVLLAGVEHVIADPCWPMPAAEAVA